LRRKDKSTGHIPVPEPEEAVEAAADSHHRPNFDVKGRALIYVDNIDPTTMHNILYFLYTGHVNLHEVPASTTDIHGHPVGYPSRVEDISALYHAANMYLLEPLEERCYRYLEETCNLNNICERLFYSAGRFHERLKSTYLEYVVEHYDEVKVTQEWGDSILKIQDSSAEEADYQLATLLEISRKLSRQGSEARGTFERG
jgi:hypothetical protein